MEDEEAKKKRTMRDAIQGLKDLFQKRKKIFGGQEEIIIGKVDIEAVLTHRARMLLLDRVLMTDQRVVGEFVVTEEVCEGHAVLNQGLVLKGSDILDMAAQLLGIIAAQDASFNGKQAMVRRYDGAKFSGPILPFEDLHLEIEGNNITRGTRGRMGVIIGEGFKATIDGNIRAEISSVELVIFDS